MPELSVAAELEEFILKEFMTGSAIDSIAPDEDLLSTGIVDSHGVLQLVGFLQEQYGIAVADDQLTPENFQTIAAIDGFVARTRG